MLKLEALTPAELISIERAARADHWVLGLRKNKHGASDYSELYTACGAPLVSSDLNRAAVLMPRYGDGYLVPNDTVKCPLCVASEIYKETVTTIEIGFDGNSQVWWRAYQQTLPRKEEDDEQNPGPE